MSLQEGEVGLGYLLIFLKIFIHAPIICKCYCFLLNSLYQTPSTLQKIPCQVSFQWLVKLWMVELQNCVNTNHKPSESRSIQGIRCICCDVILWSFKKCIVFKITCSDICSNWWDWRIRSASSRFMSNKEFILCTTSSLTVTWKENDQLHLHIPEVKSSRTDN